MLFCVRSMFIATCAKARGTWYPNDRRQDLAHYKVKVTSYICYWCPQLTDFNICSVNYHQLRVVAGHFGTNASNEPTVPCMFVPQSVNYQSILLYNHCSSWVTCHLETSGWPPKSHWTLQGTGAFVRTIFRWKFSRRFGIIRNFFESPNPMLRKIRKKVVKIHKAIPLWGSDKGNIVSYILVFWPFKVT